MLCGTDFKAVSPATSGHPRADTGDSGSAAHPAAHAYGLCAGQSPASVAAETEASVRRPCFTRRHGLCDDAFAACLI